MATPRGRRKPADVDDVFAGSRRIELDWPGLAAKYAWLPPYEGAARTTPNTLQIVFSSNAGVAMEYDRIVHDLTAVTGGLYIVGSEPTTLLNVPDQSEILRMHLDMSMLRSAAERENIRHFELEPSLRGQGPVTLSHDPVMLGVGHVLRRACLSKVALSDIEANHLAHLLVQRVLLLQHGIDSRRSRPAARLGNNAIRMVFDFIETNLESIITLDHLASLVGLSPFHFARSSRIRQGSHRINTCWPGASTLPSAASSARKLRSGNSAGRSGSRTSATSGGSSRPRSGSFRATCARPFSC